ncbi:hypothetical protein ACTQ49_00800 [Luteococcus sp. Sow4_B9]|uniref:hypothetical protein n=1 Tax=Luteococcus sp. Sow4_B9 TaxID=3438792 RepID=UPI003F95E8EF
MSEIDSMSHPSSSGNLTSRKLAIGGTIIAAVLFLVVGIGSLVVNNGIFSAGIAVMLILYACALLGLAWLSVKGLGGIANGLIAAAAVLHTFVAGSTAKGSDAWWLWIFAAVAAVTAIAAGKVHLDELKVSV